jgi:hypothetical protein
MTTFGIPIQGKSCLLQPLCCPKNTIGFNHFIFSRLCHKKWAFDLCQIFISNLSLSPVKTNVTKNFLLYAKQVLERNGKETTEEKIESYRPLVEQQLATIEKLVFTGAIGEQKKPPPIKLSGCSHNKRVAKVPPIESSLPDTARLIRWISYTSILNNGGKTVRKQ